MFHAGKGTVIANTVNNWSKCPNKSHLLSHRHYLSNLFLLQPLLITTSPAQPNRIYLITPDDRLHVQMIVNHTLVSGHGTAKATGHLWGRSAVLGHGHVTLERGRQWRRCDIRIVAEVRVPWLEERRNLVVATQFWHSQRGHLPRALRRDHAANCCTSPPRSPRSSHWEMALPLPNCKA